MVSWDRGPSIRGMTQWDVISGMGVWAYGVWADEIWAHRARDLEYVHRGY